LRLLLWLALACKSDDVKDTTPPDDSDPVADDTDEVIDSDTESDSPIDTDVEPAGPTSAVLASGPIVCADPNARLVEGMYLKRSLPITPATHYHLEGGNSAIGDIDGDDLPDTVVVGQTEVLAYFQDGPLIETDPVRLLVEPFDSDVTGLYGATLVDIDADGDLDILVTGRGVPDHLLQNDGYGAFLDVTAESGLTKTPGHHSTGASFADIDGDADLDLFIGGHGFVDETAPSPASFGPGDPSRLYLNDGTGHFTDVSDRIPQALHDGYTFLGGWLDADGDGDQDLYMVNDFGGNKRPCSLAWNDGGTFRADDNAAGLDAAIAGMGLAIGDFDGDGDEDIGVPAWKRNVLYLNNGGLWFESAQVRGWVPELPRAVGWGSEMIDVENDGRMDLSTAYGYLDTQFGGDNTARQPDAMHVQMPDGMLVERSAAGGFDDPAPHRSITPGDLNRDGWLDFVKTGLDGQVRFMMSRCGEETWLEVELRAPPPNTYAVGATIRAFHGDRQWMRVVRAGGTGYGGGSSLETHFGLGDVAVLDRLVVEWPDGTTETWIDVPTRQHLRITRAP
jgi:hypothetical protein